MLRLPEAVEQRLLELERRLGGSSVLLVGGAVRELLLDRRPGDFDVEVLGLTQDELIQQIEGLWPVTAHRVGRIFSVLKVAFTEFALDLSASEATDFGESARRRDFTINAMAWDCAGRRLLDPFGGQADLQARVLRRVDPATFVEDPLRVYRAAQFAARLDFRLEVETEALCQDLVTAGALDALPAERISEEWKKLLLLPPRPSVGLEMLRSWGVLRRCYPELQALLGVPQDQRWHPEGDTWVHTLMVVDAAAALCRQSERQLAEADKAVVMFGALLHDLGKVGTTRVEDDPSLSAGCRVTAHGHEAAGRQPAQRFLQRLRLGEQVELGVLECVTEHMRPSQLTKAIEAGELSQRQATNALRRLLRDVPKAGWPAFIAMCEADRRGRGDPETRGLPYRPAEVLGALLTSSEPTVLAPDTLIKGRDLLEMGLSPGPAMGELIARVEQQRDEGLVATREEALAWLRDHLSSEHPRPEFDRS